MQRLCCLKSCCAEGLNAADTRHCKASSGAASNMVLATLRPCLADCSLQLAGGPGSNTIAMTELAVCVLLMYTCRGLQCFEGRYYCLSNMSCMLRHFRHLWSMIVLAHQNG